LAGRDIGDILASQSSGAPNNRVQNAGLQPLQENTLMGHQMRTSVKKVGCMYAIDPKT